MRSLTPSRHFLVPGRLWVLSVCPPSPHQITLTLKNALRQKMQLLSLKGMGFGIIIQIIDGS